VCGILDDVYVALRCNARVQAYGFVRFLKVRYVEKIVQALNNVWFGHFRIWAKVAQFKRNET
jgi:RNA recognition motif-containing protein